MCIFVYHQLYSLVSRMENREAAKGQEILKTNYCVLNPGQHIFFFEIFGPPDSNSKLFRLNLNLLPVEA